LDLESWPGYALLAELFDLLAGDPNSAVEFFEYLSQPATDIPIALLVSIAGDENDARGHLAAAIRLWSLSLLGIVNRHQQPREEWYLGIFRFLRGIREASNHVARDYQQVIEATLDRAIRFTRKWGLYGQVNEIRQNLVSPLRILQAQHGNEGRAQL